MDCASRLLNRTATIAAQMTEDDLELLAMSPVVDGPVPGTPGGTVATGTPSSAEPLQPRPFSIRALADRVRSLRP